MNRTPGARFAAAFTGAAVTLTAHAQTVIDPELRAVTVASDLGAGPQSALCVGAVFVSPTTALLANRAVGQIFRIDLQPGAVAQPGPVVLDLDVISPAPNDTQTEYGVQAIALHPDFAINGYVYIRYDQSLTPGADTPQSQVVLGPNFSASIPTNNVIERYIWDPNANGGDGALVFDRLIHTVVMDTRYHHGGPIVFGPDGMLYCTYGNLRHQPFVTGNGGPLLAANAPGGIVDDYGAVIRLTPDGDVPADNPFVNVAGAPAGTETWFAYGIRNSFGMAFDPASGALWQTDNGESTYDEINLVFPGFNSGSLPIIGPLNAPGQTGSLADLVFLPGASYADPLYSWTATIGVTGMAFLYGSGLGASYGDALLVGAFNNGALRLLRLTPARDAFLAPPTVATTETIFGTGFGSTFRGILAITLGPDRLPYILTATGQLIRVERVSCPGDINNDGVVNISDLIILVSDFGPAAPGDPADINGDGVVDFPDLSALLSDFGAICAPGVAQRTVAAPPPSVPLTGVRP